MAKIIKQVSPFRVVMNIILIETSLNLLGIARWKHTCTKFRTWELTQFKRVVFMDSDMLVVNPIDHALYSYSNASFAAGKSYIDMFHDHRRSFFLSPLLHLLPYACSSRNISSRYF
jgi:alpha-N-acetylglucosamine transferase